ncbi:hypothetical protein DCS_01362 [Drechmeria coniospora]|uniref:Uncharacterized protein n=1 Tax=Drechmeria coniospora TaxID=98403 RepID=A0A151GSZ2_DRECN|nr:hypothetical protein DCS_01362 [Drechmeria coniospora]KYK60225.1 hypothetical protein DCS_01362 [Drechmeria coniospora]
MPSTHIPADTWTELTKVTGEPFVTYVLSSPLLASPRLITLHLASPRFTSLHLATPHFTSLHRTSPRYTALLLTSPQPPPPPPLIAHLIHGQLYVTHPNVGQCRYKKVEPGNKTDEKDLRQPEDSFRFVGAGSLNVWSPVATEINWRV